MLAAIGLSFMHDSNEVALVASFAAVIGSFLVSYTRAKAEALGLRGDVGFGSRVERVVLIAVGLVLRALGLAAVADLRARRARLADRRAADPLRAAPAARARRAQPRELHARSVAPRDRGAARRANRASRLLRSTEEAQAERISWLAPQPRSSALLSAARCPPSRGVGADRAQRDGCAAPGGRAGPRADLVPLRGAVADSSLAWGAVNARPPSQATPQVAFKLQYGGSIGPNGCGAVHGARRSRGRSRPARAPDGSHWALQAWQRMLPNYGVARHRRPRGLGAAALALVGPRRRSSRSGRTGRTAASTTSTDG